MEGSRSGIEGEPEVTSTAPLYAAAVTPRPRLSACADTPPPTASADDLTDEVRWSRGTRWPPGGPRLAAAAASRQPSAEPAQQGRLACGVLLDRALLVVHVSEVRVTRTEVHGGHAHRGEPGDVGPALLCLDRQPQRLDERLRGRQVQTRARTTGVVDHLDVETGEHVANVRLGIRLGQRGCIAVVDRDDAAVRDDIGGDAARHEDRVERLTELQLVHHVRARLVGDKAGKDLRSVMDGVVPP